MNAVDFFCGGGGMTRGLLDAGINVLFGLDFNFSCQKTYEYNNKIDYICEDITKINPQDLLKKYPILSDSDELLLVGCAPCQPFSKQRHSSSEHVAVNLLDEFGRMVRFFQPAHVLIENVPGIETRGAPVFNRFLQILNEMNYNVIHSVVNAKDYGVPQNRKRMILIASRFFNPQIPPAVCGKGLLPYRTVRNAIAHYPSIKAGETKSSFFNHHAAALMEINLKRISKTPHDGGSRLDWNDDSLKLKCHNKHSGHTDVYGRMKWDDVAPTLTSKCFSLSNGRFGHPEQDRAISLREAAALQSFDDSYQFFGTMQEIGKQIGNAVPVQLAHNIGSYILTEHNLNKA